MEFAIPLQCNNTGVGGSIPAGAVIQSVIGGTVSWSIPVPPASMKKEEKTDYEILYDYMKTKVPFLIYEYWQKDRQKEYDRGWEECMVEYDIDI